MKHKILTVGLPQDALFCRAWNVVPFFDLAAAEREILRQWFSLVLVDLECGDARTLCGSAHLQHAPVIALGTAEDGYGWPVHREAELFLPLSVTALQLTAYVSAMLQTNENTGAFLRPDPSEGWPLQQGDFFVDRINGWASVRGRVVRLREDEMSLLVYFLLHARRVLPYHRVNFWVQMNDYGMDEAEAVAELRNKIEPNPSAPVYLQTLPELGYCFYDTACE